jgi:uncharacterized protein YndB with AHSA1/START domain
MATTAETPAHQVYVIFIKASPEAIWAAITKPELTRQYFHGASIQNSAERHVAHGPCGELWGDEPVAEFDPPRRLVHGWRSLYDDELAKEEESRVAWEIEPQEGGYSRLTVVHDRLEGAPRTAAHVGGAGWMFVLSNLKTLLETGEALTP